MPWGYYVPVADAAGLARLEDRWSREKRVLWRWIWAAGTVAALLIAINLATTAFEPGASRGLRSWSVFPTLAFAVLLIPLAVRTHWLRRRALATQRRLLGHRGLLGRESEIRAAEEHIAERLADLAPPNAGAQAALAAARADASRLLEELSRIGLGGTKEAEGERRREITERRLITVLDGYAQALETMAVEAALDPTYFSSHTATGALERARELLGVERGPVTEQSEKRDRHQKDIAPDATVGDPEAEPPDHSIAVLPFADLSLEADQEYFTNGLTEELIGALTKIPGLRVIARSSAFAFRDRDLEADEIGRQLNVERLIRGSVRKAGDRLRVTIQLVETSDGSLLWSDRYDGEMGDVFSIQDQLTASVVEHLRSDLAAEIPERLTAGRTTDVGAYHFYLRGRHLWNMRTPADLRDSLFYFEEAIERDPEYALAYAGLADSHTLLGYYSILSPNETFPEARRAAERALEIDDNLAEAHCSLAFGLLLYDWDWAGAEREFRRTLELNPGYATAHHWYAEHLTWAGRWDEAIRQAAIALRLDPVSPIINVLVGWVYYYARRYDEAVGPLEAALVVDPEFAPAELWLALTYQRTGRHEEARETFESAMTHSGRTPMLLAALAHLLAADGDTEAADTLVEELREATQTSYVQAYDMATVCAGYGQRDEALEWLEKSLRERESWMVFLGVDPTWDSYRDDGRFVPLMEAVGLAAHY